MKLSSLEWRGAHHSEETHWNPPASTQQRPQRFTAVPLHVLELSVPSLPGRSGERCVSWPQITVICQPSKYYECGTIIYQIPIFCCWTDTNQKRVKDHVRRIRWQCGKKKKMWQSTCSDTEISPLIWSSPRLYCSSYSEFQGVSSENTEGTLKWLADTVSWWTQRNKLAVSTY